MRLAVATYLDEDGDVGGVIIDMPAEFANSMLDAISHLAQLPVPKKYISFRPTLLIPLTLPAAWHTDCAASDWWSQCSNPRELAEYGHPAIGPELEYLEMFIGINRDCFWFKAYLEEATEEEGTYEAVSYDIPLSFLEKAAGIRP